MRTRLPLEYLVAIAVFIRLFSLDTVGAGAGKRYWTPVKDEVYLQEIGRQVRSARPLTSVAVEAGRVFAGTPAGLVELSGENWTEVAGVRGAVRKLLSTPGAMTVLTEEGVFQMQAGAWKKTSDLKGSDLCEHRGRVVVSVDRRLWEARAGILEVLPGESAAVIEKLVSHSDTLYVLSGGVLTTYADGEFGSANSWGGKPETAWEFGELPSRSVRCLLSRGGVLLLGTARGLGVIRGLNLTSLRGEDGLCYEDVTSLADGFANDTWVGTSWGAIRMVDGQFQYFAGERWLPDNRINAIAVAGRTVYLATPQGLGILEYQPFTLQKKAELYEQLLERWGQKRLGFVHKLEWDEPGKQFVREISDNDGGYTEDYLAAQAYRYAVTRDPAARREATNTFHAMRWLEGITGIPGFPARAIYAKDELCHKSMMGSGSYPAEWHDAKAGPFQWKGDTSSDEIAAHFYGIPIFLELAAEGAEVGQGRELLERVSRHLMGNGWRLLDVDGLPTRWGRWDPEYFQSAGEGLLARGLNGLQILSCMKTAAVLTQKKEFSDGYAKLVELNYPNYTLRLSTIFPPEAIAHFDDQLALFVYGNLIRQETNAELRSVYLRSLERTWELIRVEQNPWFNFVYGALTDHDCDVEVSVDHLRSWPLDLRVHSFQNSHRADYRTPPGYSTRKGGVRSFLPRETQPMRWDNWTMNPDGGSGGREVEHPAAWLVAYWLGRYHGFIEAPTATDLGVLHSQNPPLVPNGAKPYVGPPRPAGF